MSEPETITLPRSGVTLVDMTETSPDFRAVVSGLVLRIYRDYHGSWNAMTWGGGCNIFKTREEAVADLDSRVIALRASLLPKGAVIVTEDEETVERIARAIAGDPCNFPSAVWDNIEPEDQLLMRRQARAVLAALNGRDGAK